MAAFTALAIASLAGTALSAAGQIKAGRAAKRAGIAQQQAAESEARLDEYNASVADLQAKDAIERGVEEESRYRAGVRGLIGAQRAGYAASGVDVGFGSPVDVQADTARIGELDALTIKTNATREAWGYNVQAFDLRQRAQIARQGGAYAAAAGRSAAGAAYLGAAGTIAAGTGNLLAMRYGFQQTQPTASRPSPSTLFNAGITGI